MSLLDCDRFKLEDVPNKQRAHGWDGVPGRKYLFLTREQVDYLDQVQHEKETIKRNIIMAKEAADDETQRIQQESGKGGSKDLRFETGLDGDYYRVKGLKTFVK